MSVLLDKNSQLTSLSLRHEIMAQNYWMFSVFILTAVKGIALVIGEIWTEEPINLWSNIVTEILHPEFNMYVCFRQFLE